MRLPLLLIGCMISMASVGQSDSLRNQHFEDIEVTFSKKKEIAYEDEKYFIMDFHVGAQGNFLLLCRFKKYHVYKLDYNMNVVDRKELDFRPKLLFEDCLGYVHILSKDSIYQLESVDDQLLIYDRNPISVYDQFLKNCVAQNDSTTIFKREINFGQTLIYYGMNKSPRDRHILYKVEDKMIVKSVIEENNRIKYQMSGREQFQQQNFFNQVITKPEFDPLYVHNDTTYIFDYLNGKVVQMNDTGAIHSTVTIDYHMTKNWKKEMQYDSNRGNFYAVHQDNGANIYSCLNKSDYTLKEGTKLTKHAYPRKVIIYNGYAYYLYKEFFDDNLNKLFRQRI